VSQGTGTMARTLKFDVFGKIMIAEAAADGRRLFVLGADGKRSPATVPVTSHVRPTSEHAGGGS
jgi:hypothetical protein